MELSVDGWWAGAHEKVGQRSWWCFEKLQSTLYGMLCKRKCQRFRPPIQRAHRFPIDPRGHLQEVEEVLGWQTVFH
jgi:hypothetical protein